MPNEDNKILKDNPGEKSLKAPFIIYADLECLLQKINTCQNNPEKSYTEKKAKHKTSGYSLVKSCSFDDTKNESSYYRGKDCMKIFCKDLRDQAMKIINYEKKKIILTNEEKSLMRIRGFAIYVRKNFVQIKIIRKNLNHTVKSEIIAIIQENIEELLIVVAIYVIKYQKRFL